MKGLTIARQTTIVLNYSPQDWDLYCYMPGVQNAAIALNRAVEDAVNGTTKELEAYSTAEKTFLKHAHFGAMDSEPMRHLEFLLRKVYRPESF